MSEYKKVDAIVPGDHVAWWQQWAKVIHNEAVGDGRALTVYDEVEKKERRFIYKLEDELRVKKIG